MKKIMVLTIADSWHHFEVPISEYQKRLSQELELNLLKPCKTGEISTIIRRDTEAISKELAKYPHSYKVFCDATGKMLGSSQATSQWIGTKLSSHKSIIFIIGGSYGLDPKLLGLSIDMTLSFSTWTLPHGLAVLTLLEQLYRSLDIIKGGKYHH